jgi:hypothetical protein
MRFHSLFHSLPHKDPVFIGVSDRTCRSRKPVRGFTPTGVRIPPSPYISPRSGSEHGACRQGCRFGRIAVGQRGPSWDRESCGSFLCIPSDEAGRTAGRHTPGRRYETGAGRPNLGQRRPAQAIGGDASFPRSGSPWPSLRGHQPPLAGQQLSSAPGEREGGWRRPFACVRALLRAQSETRPKCGERHAKSGKQVRALIPRQPSTVGRLREL